MINMRVVKDHLCTRKNYLVHFGFRLDHPQFKINHHSSCIILRSSNAVTKFSEYLLEAVAGAAESSCRQFISLFAFIHSVIYLQNVEAAGVVVVELTSANSATRTKKTQDKSASFMI